LTGDGGSCGAQTPPARAYEAFRPRVEALYAIPETRYEVPALVFPAAPSLRSWQDADVDPASR
jgi:hypothetical protein